MRILIEKVDGLRILNLSNEIEFFKGRSENRLKYVLKLMVPKAKFESNYGNSTKIINPWHLLCYKIESKQDFLFCRLRQVRG